jgi:ATP-dependent helicase/nuclease subunit B
LSEARQVLATSPEGLPLVFLAPKQGTYQLEQQLVTTPALAGYTRLSILSFESLARSIFSRLDQPAPPALNANGRLMVLRSLLSRHRENLKLFRASARLTGFARELSAVLTEIQRAGLDPSALKALSVRVAENQGLGGKLQDLATLLEEYSRWLQVHSLQDEDLLLKTAADGLRQSPAAFFRVEHLWLDGFADLSELELDLLEALIPRCDHITLTFCLKRVPVQKGSWLSHWTTIEKNFETCQKRFARFPGLDLRHEILSGVAIENRFTGNPVLGHLERFWEAPQPYVTASVSSGRSETKNSVGPAPSVPLVGGRTEMLPAAKSVSAVLRLAPCPDREAEVILAAREILEFVRAGARYRDTAVLVRQLEPYYQIVHRVFGRYEIPFFLDRRESISHHPLTELTRSSLRLVAFGWQHEDWFAALKCGFVPAQDEEIDLLENEALARGWKGSTWLQPLQLKASAGSNEEKNWLDELGPRLEKVRRESLPPFERFANHLAAARYQPTGPQLASAIRDLWNGLNVSQQLERWAASDLQSAKQGGVLPVHETVWRQMTEWLEAAELAFVNEPMSLRDWLPILEAGLANLTVGIIPPALDQVLVGAVDRSRTPEVKFALVLGLNEGVFPSKPDTGRLLTEPDRLELERHNVILGSTGRSQLGRERYLAYIACTRARQRLVLSWAMKDDSGSPLNPSSLLGHIRQLFPELPLEITPSPMNWEETQHPNELVGTLLRRVGQSATAKDSSGLSLPGLGSLSETLQDLILPPENEALAPDLALRLYGPVLRTSVSRIEQFAACPFRFFVHSGLRAEERKQFELDVKEQGTFQHEVLAMFHQTLRAENKQWRDLTPTEAKRRVKTIAVGLLSSFREGLLQTSEQARFTATVLSDSLQDFVETLVSWMREQYQFDPVEVELPFGESNGAPTWALDLSQGRRLELRGRIDRVDLFRDSDSDRALCVVVDYKSSHKQLEPILIYHGLQLQLLSYLNVLQDWPTPEATFAVRKLEPVGVFYVNLKGRYSRQRNRLEALAEPEHSRKLAYRHSGRFDSSVLSRLDSRQDVAEGDQFNYRITKRGQVNKNCREALATADFKALLKQSAEALQTLGQAIYAGRVEVEPYRKGVVTACDQCSYQGICRIDPWTHRFRVLQNPGNSEDLQTSLNIS